jgi:hypothetical protein
MLLERQGDLPAAIPNRLDGADSTHQEADRDPLSRVQAPDGRSKRTRLGKFRLAAAATVVLSSVGGALAILSEGGARSTDPRPATQRTVPEVAVAAAAAHQARRTSKARPQATAGRAGHRHARRSVANRARSVAKAPTRSVASPPTGSGGNVPIVAAGAPPPSAASESGGADANGGHPINGSASPTDVGAGGSVSSPSGSGLAASPPTTTGGGSHTTGSGTQPPGTGTVSGGG